MYNEKIKQAVDNISKMCIDGDVINISGHTSPWNIHLQIGFWGIRKAQRKLFKNPGILKVGQDTMNPNDDTHTGIYFTNANVRKYVGEHLKVKRILEKEPYAKIFSVEPPKATLVPVEDWALDDLRIYRLTQYKVQDDDIRLMLEGTLPILGTRYDFGQLLDIAMNQIAGYPFKNRINLFDLGTRLKVCSVGVASVYAYLRHEREKAGIYMPRLFSTLNESTWNKDFIKHYLINGEKWSVEQTYPCMFGLTETHFNKEFQLILWIKEGEIKYKKNIEN